MKKNGISKIQEKNERIKSIMEELQIQETIYNPQLDDSEVPERIINVAENEVHVEKVFLILEILKQNLKCSMLASKKEGKSRKKGFRMKSEHDYKSKTIGQSVHCI